MRHPIRCTGALLLCVAAGSWAQQPDERDAVSLDDYLTALAHISPAARTGADAYLAAFRQRCRRALTVRELRRMVADRDGDPTLMGMIRAAAFADDAGMRALAQSISCVRRG